MRKAVSSYTAMFLLGPVHIYWYGLTISLAIVIGLLITWGNVKKHHEDFSVVIDILLWCIPLGIVFGRGLYVIFHWQIFSDRLLNIFLLSGGGLSIYGAFIGFLCGTVFYLYLTGRNFWYWMDIFLPGMIACLIVYQIGNFCMQNTIGTPLPVSYDNDHSIAEYIDFKQRPTGFEGYLYFRPVALYQAVVLGVIFLVSLLLTAVQLKYSRIQQGNIFLSCMVLIAVCRFVFGFMYLSSNTSVILHSGQYFALILIACCLIIYWLRRRAFQREKTYHY